MGAEVDIRSDGTDGVGSAIGTTVVRKAQLSLKQRKVAKLHCARDSWRAMVFLRMDPAQPPQCGDQLWRLCTAFPHLDRETHVAPYAQ